MGTQIVELPATYRFVWKVDNFSKLYSDYVGIHYSDTFLAGGAKWRVQMFPKGVGTVFSHLSLYLYCTDSAKYPVDAKYSFKITSQTDPTVTRTHSGEKQFAPADHGSGSCYFVPLKRLLNPKVGYVLDDTCEITIEITCKMIVADVQPTIKNKIAANVKKLVELPATFKFIWKIDNFSNLYLNNKVEHYSDIFSAGGARWKVQIYPKGEGKVFDHLSVYLYCEDSNKYRVDAKFGFAITSQTDPTDIVSRKSSGERHFTADGWGFSKFILLSKLHDSKTGYILNDTCNIEIEIICKMINAEAEKPIKEEPHT